MSLFTPDRIFPRISKIDLREDIVERGYDTMLLDIDNTIRSRETGEIPDDVADWLRQAKDANISICLLSNNWHDNVHDFAREVDLPIVAKACKPLPHGYLIAKHKLGSKRRSVVAIGDQLFTDVLGANICGMGSYLVMPLAKKDLKHMKLMRGIERRILGDALEAVQEESNPDEPRS